MMDSTDESGVTGRRDFNGEKDIQGKRPLPHPPFRAGESSTPKPGKSSLTARTESHPQVAFDQRPADLGSHHPVSSCISDSATCLSTNNRDSGKRPVERSNRN